MVERKGPVKPPTIDLEARGNAAGEKKAGPSAKTSKAQSKKARDILARFDLPTLSAGAALGALIAVLIGSLYIVMTPQNPTPPSATNDTLALKLDTIETRLEAFETQIATPADTSALTTLGTELAKIQTERAAQSSAIEARLNALENRTSPTATPNSVEIEAINAKIDTLSAAIKTNDDDPAADERTALKSDIAALTERLTAFETAPTAAPVETSAASRLILALAGLDAALLAGRPFATEIETITQSLPALTPADTIIAAAPDGLPTLAAANRAFAKSVPAILAARPTREGISWQDTLMEKAKSILAIRPANPTDATSPDALVARIEQALEGADLETAAALITQLSSPMRAAGGRALTDITNLAAARTFATNARQAALAPDAKPQDAKPEATP